MTTRNTLDSNAKKASIETLGLLSRRPHDGHAGDQLAGLQ